MLSFFSSSVKYAFVVMSGSRDMVHWTRHELMMKLSERRLRKHEPNSVGAVDRDKDDRRQRLQQHKLQLPLFSSIIVAGWMQSF